MIKRQDVRPEYSTGPDDDLYGSPRSWSGAQWEESKEETDPEIRMTQTGFESTLFPREEKVPSFETGMYRDRTYSELRKSLPRHRKTSLLDRREQGQGLSAWTLQAIAALFLIGASFFMFHSTRPLAMQLQRDIRSAFSNDDLSVLLPKQIAYALGTNLPSSEPAVAVSVSAMQMVIPLKGTIVRPYSLISPDLVIEGRPGAEVVAATDGLVTAVAESQANGKYIMIDHGAFGQTFYAHLGQITVHTNEYVVAGQGIGYLPKDQRELVFGYIRGNAYHNPTTFFGEAK
ncbi:M23 family metallopeptidase [Sulfoacidibacillus thermotolerans]|uniref:M23ase beta-sheet core domain-containing protein n=1 Tax=Sulfoacidibacillus thermotolerans TaxID=1765684 RepID=A0A2U3DC15_SULT2|nr:M23 family metallopeptidase [Sulfoacidibacillus thermotolerans]PWI58821.1 hypothetical protein BM613_01640 [Sulfoacidibacillus thermotolerans]